MTNGEGSEKQRGKTYTAECRNGNCENVPAAQQNPDTAEQNKPRQNDGQHVIQLKLKL